MKQERSPDRSCNSFLTGTNVQTTLWYFNVGCSLWQWLAKLLCISRQSFHFTLSSCSILGTGNPRCSGWLNAFVWTGKAAIFGPGFPILQWHTKSLSYCLTISRNLFQRAHDVKMTQYQRRCDVHWGVISQNVSFIFFLSFSPRSVPRKPISFPSGHMVLNDIIWTSMWRSDVKWMLIRCVQWVPLRRRPLACRGKMMDRGREFTSFRDPQF